MKKRIFTLALALALMLSVFGSVPASAASYDDNTSLAVAVLEGLGAYEDGAISRTAYITRGEFARLLACALGRGGEADSYARRTMYTDVPAGSANASYINLVSSEGVFSGDGNGSFGPDEALTWDDAVTAALKALGYTSSDIGTAWPDDYLDKARELGLSGGLSLPADSRLTGGQAALLLCNMLRADTVSGAAFATTISDASVQQAILLSNSAVSDLGASSVKVYAGGATTYYARSGSLPGELVGTRGTLLLNSAGAVCGFIPDAASVVSVRVKSATSAGITAEGGAVYSIPASASLVYRGERYSYATGYVNLTGGSTVRLYLNSDGDVETVGTPTATSGKAVIASSSGAKALSSFIRGLGVTGDYTIYKNGEAASVDDLAKYDVATWDASNAAILVSDRRITGVIEAVYPSMDAPQTVTVSGAEYSVTELAQGDFAKLSLGRTVTLLLTTDAAVAAVETAAKYKSDMIGVLSENADGTCTVSLAGGLALTGECSDAEERLIGTLVSVRSSGAGKISVSPISASGSYGRLVLEDMTLGSCDMAPGAAVYEWAGRGCVAEISLDDIYWTDTVGASSVSYAHLNSSGQVDVILLKNVTGAARTYGLVSVSGGRLSVENSSGSTGELTGAGSVRTGSFVGVAYTASGAAVDVVTLKGRSVERSDFVGGEYVEMDGVLYRISGDVQVYNSTMGSWYTDSAGLGTALEQALAYSDDITVYCDRDAESGGCIRVVAVE